MNTWARPRLPVPTSGWLLPASLILLIALPFVVSEVAPVVAVVVVLSAAALLGSTSTAVFTLCFLSAVIPTDFYEEHLLLPLGFKFYEGLFVLVGGMAFLRWLVEGKLAWPRRTPLDRSVRVFLFLVIASIAIGKFYGQSTSQMLRDVRYPLYYALFFVVTFYTDARTCRTFLYVTLAASALVGIEYLAEFLNVVDVAITGSFFRVARVEGLMLPMGVLIATSALLYDPSKARRLAAGLTLLPTGLAIVLTVGRGMWVSLLVGLFALGGLTLMDPLARRRGRRLILIALLPLVVLGTGYAFQQITGVGLGETAYKRVARIGSYEEDHSIVGRLLSFQVTLRKIRNRPLLGGGHGETVSYLVTETVEPFVLTTGQVDNLYLTILLRMGLVGMLAFLWMFAGALMQAYRLFRTSQDELTRQFVATFIVLYAAMLVYGMADSTMIGNRLVLFHTVFLGLIARMVSDRLEENRMPGPAIDEGN